MSKINCPYHEDHTASMHIYADHAYCFGCGKRASLDEIETPAIKKYPFKGGKYTGKPVNLKEKIASIRKGEVRSLRGFNLHCDGAYYYLIYPNDVYYVARSLRDDENTSKYRSPYGHKKPLYIANKGDSDTLFVVEGQFNALSLAVCLKDTDVSYKHTIISPGAATDLNRNSFVQYYLQYKNICIIVDKDAAGVAAGVELKDTLLKHDKRVYLLAVEQDINDLHVTQGQEKVKEFGRACLGMLRVW